MRSSRGQGGRSPRFLLGCVLASLAAGLSGCASGGVDGAGTDRSGTVVDAGSPAWTEIGRSVQGRAIEAATVGSGGRRILLIGGIHGNEREGLACLDALVSTIRAWPATVRVVRDMNPDGTAARRRGNARGVDLNRNWPARNFNGARDRGAHPLSEPESSAVAVELAVFDPDLVVVLHSTPGGPFVNYDGPARPLAVAFARAAGWRVVASMGYETPGSLGSWIGVDRGIPILTIELARGRPASCDSLASGLRAVLGAGEP